MIRAQQDEPKHLASTAQKCDNKPPSKPSTAALFSTPPMPANVELALLTPDLVPSFKRILGLTLPVAYPPVFFTESMEEPFHSITLMALWHPTPTDGTNPSETSKPRLVGAIRCRILPSANLYISTISLLAPYRSHGIATHLLQKVAAKAVDKYGVRCVTAHVWEANEEGLEWYKKRGFDIIGKEDAYYHKLKPSGGDVTYTITCLGPRCTDGPPTTFQWPSGWPQPTTEPETTVKTTSSTKKMSSTSRYTPPPETSSVKTTKGTSSTTKYTPPPEITKTPTKTTKSSQKPTKTQTEVTGPSSTKCPVPLYYQCGGLWDGKPWTGCTKCEKGASCVYQNGTFRIRTTPNTYWLTCSCRLLLPMR
ncbi:hypothetical protein BU23DRAFT_452259 [Bimuria novae-zelandiae CBS 107.79]|uniref:N-acetyltransferase domain-containing protein n=1 Tax=Bimuria novae-zelandiae CBS 107.79 TaxID=1447943 RepID=A0A6A5VS50_9PLEO|nr:hypothetical protein BU23DRAFT_452259 [Bimuria novae-zelandiae CBS 107.79]